MMNWQLFPPISYAGFCLQVVAEKVGLCKASQRAYRVSAKFVEGLIQALRTLHTG